MKIILGSESIWRRQIMRQIVPDFEVMVSGIDEKQYRHSSPQAMTMMLARAKSEALRPLIKEPAVLITSDQVVVCNGVIREKPVDADQARRFLRSYRAYSAVCVTSVMAYNTETGCNPAVTDRATVWFKDLTDEAIEHFIAEKIIFSCAGGFAAGHPSFEPYMERIEGTIESVMGLPKELTHSLIITAQGE